MRASLHRENKKQKDKSVAAKAKHITSSVQQERNAYSLKYFADFANFVLLTDFPPNKTKQNNKQ